MYLKKVNSECALPFKHNQKVMSSMYSQWTWNFSHKLFLNLQKNLQGLFSYVTQTWLSLWNIMFLELRTKEKALLNY